MRNDDDAPIRVRDLTKEYRRKPVLDRVNLHVASGSVYALVGPNGAGKTTTIKILVNLLKASSGICEVLGCDSRRLEPRHFAEIGYVSENQELPGWMTAGYYLDYLSNFYPTWDGALCADLVKRFELPRDRKLRHFSRGMYMKAALAAGMAFRPRLLVLDEPFTGLDVIVRDELIAGVQTRSEGTTVFVSSHDLTEVESFATHIGFLDSGRLYLSEELKSLSERFREIVITFSGEAPEAPGPWPEHWLVPQRNGCSLRITESRFTADGTVREAERLFPGNAGISVEPMSLRSIFLALAKASRPTS
jgi:ABC-2 type transport system ATP-binding protein